MGFFILMWVIVDFRWCLPTLRCCLNARVVMQKRAEHENSGDGVIVVVTGHGAAEMEKNSVQMLMVHQNGP